MTVPIAEEIVGTSIWEKGYVDAQKYGRTTSLSLHGCVAWLCNPTLPSTLDFHILDGQRYDKIMRLRSAKGIEEQEDLEQYQMGQEDALHDMEEGIRL